MNVTMHEAFPGRRRRGRAPAVLSACRRYRYADAFGDVDCVEYQRQATICPSPTDHHQPRRRHAVPCLPRHSMLNSSILVQDVVALEFVDVAGQFMDRSPRQTAKALHDPSHRGLARPGVQGQLGRQRVATAIVGEVSRRDTEGTSPARPLRVRWIRAGTRAQLREVRRRQLNPGPLRDDADSDDRSLPESMRDQSETTGPAAPRPQYADSTTSCCYRTPAAPRASR